MPELPEVEIVRRALAKAMTGRAIASVHVRDARVVKPSARALDALVGKRVGKVERRGKWLRIALDRDHAIFSHLGMTGDWVAKASDAAAVRSERVRIDLKKGTRVTSVCFNDARMFGRVIAATNDIDAWRELGPDPLADGIDDDAFYEALHAKKRTIKEALLDQTLIAGVGNILAIEALWRAKIDPRSRTNALTLAHVRAIARGVHASIEASFDHYAAAGTRYATDPRAPTQFKAYGRAGSPCPRCKTILTKHTIGGRTTTHCPHCQLLIK